jgi:hypothetical protein
MGEVYTLFLKIISLIPRRKNKEYIMEEVKFIKAA